MSWTSSAVGSKASVVTDLEAKAAGEATASQSEGRDSHGGVLPTAPATAQADALVAALPGVLATVGGPDADVFVSINGHASEDRLEDVVTMSVRVRSTL